MNLRRILSGTRYLVILPILGLAVAAAVIFVLGGIGLIGLMIELLALVLGFSHEGGEFDSSVAIFEIVESVHTFLVGTVVYITAIGLYQLFIGDIELPDWLEIHNTEELETSLISVTVVVLAVNLMGTVLVGTAENLLDFGAGIALPIAALALFVGLRAWATKMGKKTAVSEANTKSSPANEAAIQDAADDSR
jgi:uncharacterized membrane protein YqhA